MRKSKFQRLTAFALAFLMIVSCCVVSVGAAEDLKNESVSSTTTSDIRALLNAISYNDYFENNKAVSRAEQEIIIDAYKDLDQTGVDEDGAKLTDAAWEKVARGGKQDVLLVPGVGKVSWTLSADDPEDQARLDLLKNPAKYNVIVNYYPEEGKATSIERIFKINGEIPFSESRYMTLPKLWDNVYPDAKMEVTGKMDAQALLDEAAAAGVEASRVDEGGNVYIIYKMPSVWNEANTALVAKYSESLRFFTTDIDRNEIRSNLKQVPEWKDFLFVDANGFRTEPFEFVITPDENGNVTLTLESVNEPIVISEIRLAIPETTISYDQYWEQYKNEPKGTGTVKIEGEYFSGSSTQTIYPVSDNTSAITSPATNKRTVLNTVGGDKWQTSGQWLEYTFTVSSAGRYQIVPRFKQHLLDGMYTSRMLEIYSEGLAPTDKGYYDGIPFEEAGRLQFDYSSDWQSGALTDGSKVDPNNPESAKRTFEFYFREGVTYTLRFKITLGNMGNIVNRVQRSLDSINADYLKILQLTGSTPDEFRDYGFSRVLPDTMIDMVYQADELTAIVNELDAAAGIKSSMTSTLEKVARLLYAMGKYDDEVAKNLEQLKTYIGSLGTWLSDAKTQPLVLDFIQIQPEGAEIPKAKANFWQSLIHEVGGFFQSFFRNYDRMGAMTEIGEGDTDHQTVEVWLAYGRDQTQVIRGLINNDFTPNYNVPINLKLVAVGTLLPSILSGRGPDVYIGLGQGDVINYAIRGALIGLEDMPGFEEAKADFNQAAMMVMEIEDADGVNHCYGLPETQVFNMMFVREDILAQLDIEIPKTWDDVKEAIPDLQAHNMMIGMSNDSNVFLYQSGGELFADNGMRINLDSNVALEAFTTMCDLFTMYSFPYKYDFANRFRTGEMPIGFASYTATYNQLKVFATEIEGLWGFYPMPGYEDEEGVINNVAVSSASAIVMITGCDNRQGAWDFMRWHVGAKCQADYSNEMVAILGPSAKHSTANEKALKELPWTAKELEQIEYQFHNLAAIPNYPGTYIISRYTQFAFLDAYSDNVEPATALQSYITTINKEITRKRAEFGLETLDYLGQTLAQKRMSQAETELTSARESSSYNSAYDDVYNNVMNLISGYETEDFASIRALADSLEKTNSDLFAKAVGYLRDAANALERYEDYK